MNLALSVASTMGADAGTPAGAAGVGGVGLCMGGLSKQGREALWERIQQLNRLCRKNTFTIKPKLVTFPDAEN
jgi:hypothetical protein